MSGDAGHRYDDVITHHHVVPDVTSSQNGIMGSDNRHFTITGRTVDGNVFANRVVVADFQAGQTAFPFQVLGPETNAGEGGYLVPPAPTRVAIDDDMGVQAASWAQNHIFSDDAIRADFAIGTNLRPGMNYRCRMN